MSWQKAFNCDAFGSRSEIPGGSRAVGAAGAPNLAPAASIEPMPSPRLPSPRKERRQWSPGKREVCACMLWSTCSRQLALCVMVEGHLLEGILIGAPSCCLAMNGSLTP